MFTIKTIGAAFLGLPLSPTVFSSSRIDLMHAQYHHPVAHVHSENAMLGRSLPYAALKCRYYSALVSSIFYCKILINSS